MGKPGNPYWNGDRKEEYEAELLRLDKSSPKLPLKVIYMNLVNTFPELKNNITSKAISHYLKNLKEKEKEREQKLNEKKKQEEELKLKEQLEGLKAVLLNYDITDVPNRKDIQIQTNALIEHNAILSQELKMLTDQLSQPVAVSPLINLEVSNISNELLLCSKEIEQMDKNIGKMNLQICKYKRAANEIGSTYFDWISGMSYHDLKKELEIQNLKREQEIQKLIKITKEVDAFEDPKRIFQYMKTLLERKNALSRNETPQSLWDKIFLERHYGKYFSNSSAVDFNECFRKIFIGEYSYRNLIVHKDGYIDTMSDLDQNRDICGLILDLLKELDDADRMHDPRNQRVKKIGFYNREMQKRYEFIEKKLRNN